MVRIFWWVEDEWAHPEWPLIGLDKLAHFMAHRELVFWLRRYGVPPWTAFAISQAAGLFWEGPVDCWIIPLYYRIVKHKKVKGGASKWDLIYNFLGGLYGAVA